MDISGIVSALSLPRKYYVLVSIVSGVIIFSSDNFLRDLSLLDFKNDYIVWVSLAFLTSLAMTFINVLGILLDKYKFILIKISRVKEKRRLDAQKIKFLNNLDANELSVLREFYISRRNTVPMSIDDPAVLGLIENGIIDQVGNLGYTSNISGTIAYFKLNEITDLYFEERDFKWGEYSNIPRPVWIDMLEPDPKLR